MKGAMINEHGDLDSLACASAAAGNEVALTEHRLRRSKQRPWVP